MTESISYRALAALVGDVDMVASRAAQAGDLVRTCRVEQRLTQTTLAERLGVSQACLSDLERGRRSWTSDMLRRVATALVTPAPPPTGPEVAA